MNTKDKLRIVNKPSFCPVCGYKKISKLRDCCDGNFEPLEHFRCKRCRKEMYIRVAPISDEPSMILYNNLRSKKKKKP